MGIPSETAIPVLPLMMTGILLQTVSLIMLLPSLRTGLTATIRTTIGEVQEVPAAETIRTTMVETPATATRMDGEAQAVPVLPVIPITQEVPVLQETPAIQEVPAVSLTAFLVAGEVPTQEIPEVPMIGTTGTT